MLIVAEQNPLTAVANESSNCTAILLSSGIEKPTVMSSLKTISTICRAERR